MLSSNDVKYFNQLLSHLQLIGLLLLLRLQPGALLRELLQLLVKALLCPLLKHTMALSCKASLVYTMCCLTKLLSVYCYTHSWKPGKTCCDQLYWSWEIRDLFLPSTRSRSYGIQRRDGIQSPTLMGMLYKCMLLSNNIKTGVREPYWRFLSRATLDALLF